MRPRIKATQLSLAFVTGLFVSHAAWAGDPSCSIQECPTAKKVSGLLEEWDAVSQEAKSASPAKIQKVSTQIAKLSEHCPVGKRLGATLASVRDVLGSVRAIGAANADKCPLENASVKIAEAACAEMKGLKAARTHALDSLHRLASYTAGACSGSCSEDGVTKATMVTRGETRGSDGCEKTVTSCSDSPQACGSTSAASCPIRMASNLGELKASWTEAQLEANALTLASRQEIVAGMHAIAGEVKMVALVPQSIFALQEGFEALTAVQDKMSAWAQANPQVMANMPPEMMQSFMIQNALLGEAQDLLGRVTTTMAVMNPSYGTDRSSTSD